MNLSISFLRKENVGVGKLVDYKRASRDLGLLYKQKEPCYTWSHVDLWSDTMGTRCYFLL